MHENFEQCQCANENLLMFFPYFVYDAYILKSVEKSNQNIARSFFVFTWKMVKILMGHSLMEL